ncbi:MAG: hypothetical protein IT489_04160 [Gammaproteobacteria bacterium]|nr:hypothetical protein [Gammaproteobacteria bacterium]
MSPWLDNVLVQSAVIPFVVALIAGLALRRAAAPWAGLGLPLGFAAAAYFIAGFQFLPLTSTRKILLAAAGAVVVAVVLDTLARDRRVRLWLPALAAAAVALWVLWPVVTRTEGAAALAAMLLPALGYTAWLIAGTDTLESRPVRSVVAVLMLAVGTGVSALLGATALMGQLGGAVAAAVGAYLLIFLWRGEFAPGRTLTLPATLLCALLGIAAVHFARLPWYSLAPLTLIPLLVRLPVPQGRNHFIPIVLAALYTLPAAAAAILITLAVAGAPPI